MADKDKLAELMNTDQEYQNLLAEANAFSGYSKFPTNVDQLDDLRNWSDNFKAMKVEEFFAAWKCMLAWAVLMSKILTKISGAGKYDTKKAFPAGLSGSKFGLIYYENNPSFFNTYDPKNPLYVSVPLRVFGGTGGSQTGEVQFRLTNVNVIYDPKAMKWNPKLLDSVMEIWIKDDQNKILFKQPLIVGRFSPNKLSVSIEISRLGD